MSKNIIVLSPTPSHPQYAGNRKRIFALTKYLQELGAIIYFVYCPREWDQEIPKDAYDGMNRCWDYFFIAYPVQPAVHRTDNEYFELDAWWDVGIEFAVNWIKLAADIDMVLCNYVFYSKVLELFDQSITKVIDTHDIVSNRNYLLDKRLGYRDFFYVSPESEKKALDRAHLILSIKDDESSWFKCLSQTPVLTIGHLEPEPSEILNRKVDYSNIKLGFIGSANPINVRNLETFLDEYWKIQNKYSDKLTFIVGGKVCDALDSRFHSQVQILGKVNNVSEFYDLVDIVVLPFEFSTGLKIKTVEALSWSKPCIGTINAFEGLGSACQYHSFKTIKQLALGVEEIVQAPQTTLPKLQQDSKIVFSNYTNSVKKSIEKLYQVDWKSIKKHQLSLEPDRTPEIDNEKLSVKKIYNFNIITNVDFWNSKTNEDLWINFWINNAKQIGNIDIYRTKNFRDLEADKLELYKLGLVDNVHHRELYQIIHLFKVNHDQNQIFINLLDFSSIIFDDACLGELEHLELVANHYLLYLFNKSHINSNHTINKNVCHLLKEDDSHSSFYLWDLNSDFSLENDYEKSRNRNILLTDNPITLNKIEYSSNNLEQIVIGTSFLDENYRSELNKLILCCQDFLPQHFKLVVFSNLDLEITNSAFTVYSLDDVINIIPTIDMFIYIDEPQSISFLIYLCICNSIPMYTINEEFTLDLSVNNLIKLIDNFTFIPQAYQAFLEQSIFGQEANRNLTHHDSWELFLEYWLAKNKNNESKSLEMNSQEFASKV